MCAHGVDLDAWAKNVNYYSVEVVVNSNETLRRRRTASLADWLHACERASRLPERLRTDEPFTS
jgi:hypothetical protein